MLVSWDAWPRAGQAAITLESDLLYKSVLADKTFMMGVSPYFYTNLPQWSKNWYSSSESLWYDRWQQVLDIMPDHVQIITCEQLNHIHHSLHNSLPHSLHHPLHQTLNH
jgi:glucan endo-1,3-alpha-glucosidase